MSGGSLDYIHWKVEEVAMRLKDKDNTPLQRAFGEHLENVAKALHDIEWVFSGDYGKGDDDEAIKVVLGENYEAKAFEVLKQDAEKLIEQLNKFTTK